MENMTKEKNWFDKLSTFMDQNIRGVQYGIYSVGGLGLLLALRSVRPFAKFSSPSDIPRHFIQKKMSFQGTVNMIQPGHSEGVNPLLLVHHKPLVSLSNKYYNDGLPLEISSVNITGNGFLWLQSLLSNKEIKFIPLRTSSDKVYSIVYNQGQNVGEHLVKIGFAVVSPIDTVLEKDQYYLSYYKTLLSAEKKAERKGAGVWANEKVPFLKSLLKRFVGVVKFPQHRHRS